MTEKKESYTFSDVSIEVFRLMNKDLTDKKAEKKIYETTETIKKHKKYFKYLAECMKVTDKLELLKNENGEYEFTNKGADMLVDVLCKYETSTRPVDISYKATIKQILDNDRYNAVIPDYLKTGQVLADNNLLLEIIECFYQLFIDSGLSEEEADNLLRDAAYKYNYQKRNEYKHISGFFLKYLETVEKKAAEPLEWSNLSSREHNLWLKYANRSLMEAAMKAYDIRSIMCDLKKQAMFMDNALYYLSTINELPERIKADMEAKEIIIKDCSEDECFQAINKEYKTITGESLDIGALYEYILSSWGTYEQNDTLRKMSRDVALGKNKANGVKLLKGDDKRIEDLLDNACKEIEVLINKFGDHLLLNEKIQGRICGEELLEKAIDEYESRPNSIS